MGERREDHAAAGLCDHSPQYMVSAHDRVQRFQFPQVACPPSNVSTLPPGSICVHISLWFFRDSETGWPPLDKPLGIQVVGNWTSLPDPSTSLSVALSSSDLVVGCNAGPGPGVCPRRWSLGFASPHAPWLVAHASLLDHCLASHDVLRWD